MWRTYGCAHNFQTDLVAVLAVASWGTATVSRAHAQKHLPNLCYSPGQSRTLETGCRGHRGQPKSLPACCLTQTFASKTTRPWSREDFQKLLYTSHICTSGHGVCLVACSTPHQPWGIEQAPQTVWEPSFLTVNVGMP